MNRSRLTGRYLAMLSVALLLIAAGMFLRDHHGQDPTPEILPSPNGESSDIPLENLNDASPIPLSWVSLDSEFEKIQTRVPIVSSEAKALPRGPFLVEGCEGEDCGQVKSLKLGCEVRFMSDPGKPGTFSFTLPAGTELAKARAFVLVTKPGSVRITADKKTVALLKLVTQDEWLTWEDGELGSWDRRADPADRATEPTREAWVYVQDEDGRNGWTPLSQRPGCPFEAI